MNYDEVMQKLENVCHTEAVCGQCSGKECLVGYAKYCLAKMKGVIPPFMDGGFDEIPSMDIKGSYDEDAVLNAISKLLVECHDCRENHKSDCVINILRACMEVIAFGDEQEFEGNPLVYMMKLSGKYPEKGALILDEYKQEKSQME